MSWEDFLSDSEMISALRKNKMNYPTEIQAESLLNSCEYHQDIIISSKTGSGKTLCFAIPLLLSIVKNEGLQGLIISPTRELCMQITSHIQAINYKELTIQTLIGGMAHEKQERLLKRKPEIIIGTPGRLWEYVIDRQNDYVRTMDKIKFLVIDEADRMIQMGHFKELRLMLKYMDSPEEVPREIAVSQMNGNVVDLNFAYEAEESDIGKSAKVKKVKRQTFVISATMTIDGYSRKAFGGKLGRFKDSGENIMEKLTKTVNFRGKPKIIDLTASSKMPEGLEEFIILCRDEQKNSFLHYVLTAYPGTKTIIFTNTISASRKLVYFLRYLDYKVSKLDGKMPQRDRLNKLEKFTKSSDILVATDVAARGLDLPLVGLIIHFNLPQNIENYIHRSGRTARIYNEGTSIAFVGPGDTKSLLAIEKLLGRKIDKFQVDNEKLKRSDEMVELACEIAEKESKNMGTTKDSTWTDRASEAIGLDRTEYKQPIGKKHIRNLKKQLSRAKNEIELPRKRGSVITPEMFKLAKLQKLI